MSKLLDQLNVVRKRVMPKLTKNIGQKHYNKVFKTKLKKPIKKVLIVRPNQRLGNLLLTTPLIQEVQKHFPNCEIDIIVKGNLGKIIFKNYNINDIIILPRKPFNEVFKYIKTWASVRSKKYDLVINAVENSSSGKLLTEFSRSRYKLFGDFDMENQILKEDRMHISKSVIYNLRHYLSKIGIPIDYNAEIPILNINIDNEENEVGKKLLEDVIDTNKKTICIFTNATGDKCYSEEWWLGLYKQMKEAFPNYNIFEMLPVENISKVNFTAPNMYSTEIRDMAAVFKNIDLFIGADSGVMHLAAAAPVTTLGLFSVTLHEVYGPYGNHSEFIQTNGLSHEIIIERIKNKLAEIES